MSVVETSQHPSVVIVADGELARKGFEYYARAAGMRVGPFGAPAKLVLRGGGSGGDVDAPMHVVVDAQGICIEPRRDPDQATIAAPMPLIGRCLPAGSMGITVPAVRSHLERIRDKTGRRVELAQLANDTNPRP
ncbi:MAG: hypothetical protein M3Y77_16450 [Actinomycetota bacterium]|nr:hypothetical protein [Actinomycetota bacterium]